MLVTASITGVFKTVLIILGAVVLLRFLGQLMIAKRNMEEERTLNARQRQVEKERMDKLKNFGKTTIHTSKSAKQSKSSPISNVEDVEYEEIS